MTAGLRIPAGTGFISMCGFPDSPVVFVGSEDAGTPAPGRGARAGCGIAEKKRNAPSISGPVGKEGENKSGKIVRVLVHQPVSATPDPDKPCMGDLFCDEQRVPGRGNDILNTCYQEERLPAGPEHATGVCGIAVQQGRVGFTLTGIGAEGYPYGGEWDRGWAAGFFHSESGFHCLVGTRS